MRGVSLKRPVWPHEGARSQVQLSGLGIGFVNYCHVHLISFPLALPDVRWQRFMPTSPMGLYGIKTLFAKTFY